LLKTGSVKPGKQQDEMKLPLGVNQKDFVEGQVRHPVQAHIGEEGVGKTGMRLATVFLCLFAARAVGAQAQGDRVPPSWTVAAVPGEGQPRGYVEFQRFCSVCHGEGYGMPGTLALQAKYKAARPALLEKRTDLKPAFIKFCVRNGISVMPSFRKTEVSEKDLDAIMEYLARNNKP
jgi:(+)-pinoresinol hydroxylase